MVTDAGQKAGTSRGRARGRGARAVVLGRRAECAVLDELVGGLRSDGGHALVLSGAAGIGKSVLLDHAVGSAGPEVRVVRSVGVETEADLPYAGLHQLCVPLLEQLTALPAPQRAALETIFWTRAGPPPDRLVVGLAVLGLLAEVSKDRPLLCVVDDAHCLDPVSAQVLGFVGRRLAAQPVGLLLGTRAAGEHLQGLPELSVGGLPDTDAHALLRLVTTTWRDERVRDRIVAEADGNPLALLELSRGAGMTQAAGAFGPAGAGASPPLTEPTLVDRIHRLPPPCVFAQAMDAYFAVLDAATLEDVAVNDDGLRGALGMTSGAGNC